LEEAKLNALRKGLLEPLILAIASAEKVYVADIVERLGATDFATKEGTLYPLLSKMRRERLLDYEWRESASGPPRKYYSTTEAGARELAITRAYLASITTLIDELRNEHAPSG